MPKKDAQNSVGAGFKPALSIGNEKPRRKRLRLPEYDYSSVGMYFITICTHQRMCLFGRIVGEEMRPNRLGTITEAVWYELPDHYPHVELDSFVVMPNHVHGIIALTERVGFKEKSMRRHSLAEVVRAFKTFLSRQINQRQNKKEPVWQRNYYEHVIRNEESLSRIREYIETNPQRWQFDRENPYAVPSDRGAGLKPAPTGIDANPGGVPPDRP